MAEVPSTSLVIDTILLRTEFFMSLHDDMSPFLKLDYRNILWSGSKASRVDWTQLLVQENGLRVMPGSSCWSGSTGYQRVT